MTEAPDVFLSYNREDATVAKLFADAIAREGLEVWWDQTLRSGEAYDKVTEAALRGAKAVVVLWSPRSVDSRWVRAEATIAERNGTLIPATIEPCERPVMFELTQTPELSHWRGDIVDKAWQAFLGDVRRMVGKDTQTPATTSSTAPTPANSGIPIVAVLPISHRGPAEELELLAEDLTEEITRSLSRSSFFEVTSASIMAGRHGKQIDHRTVKQELGVNYLTEGKLQRSGDTIRVVAQTIDTATGNMVWTKRFARKADEVEASPEDFSLAIASELGEVLLQIEFNRAMAKSGPWSGWEHTLRALAYSSRLGLDNFRKGIEEAQKAVALAPDLALAHATLAASFCTALFYEVMVLDDVVNREIRAHMTRALQLDSGNPLVVGILAYSYPYLGDAETGLQLARRIVELDPGSPRSFYVLGHAQMALGRIAEAIESYERQDEITSLDVVRYIGLAFLGMCRLLQGDAAKAEEALDRSLALYPDCEISLKWKAISASLQGDDGTALATVRRLREVEPDRSIDQHVRQMMFFTGLRDRMVEPALMLRRLWAETGGNP